jgi:hypothetical protein
MQFNEDSSIGEGPTRVDLNMSVAFDLGFEKLDSDDDSNKSDTAADQPRIYKTET